jgi:transposase-like protein
MRCPFCGSEEAHIDWDSEDHYYCPVCGATFTDRDLMEVRNW